MTVKEIPVGPPSQGSLVHLNRALVEVPIYELHHRGRNWLAVIGVDAQSPGGFTRRFMPRGRGAVYYSIEALALFDPIEFGADYFTTTSRRVGSRWYGVVWAITETHVHLYACNDGIEACLRSRECQGDPMALLKAREVEALSLERRLAATREAIETLQAAPDTKKENPA